MEDNPLLVASEVEIDDWFTKGHCHEFAMALHRLTGLPMRGLTAEWRGRPWTAERDGWVHIFVEFPDGRVADVRGVRPVGEVKSEYARATMGATVLVAPLDEADITSVCGDWAMGAPLSVPLNWSIEAAETLVRGRLASRFVDLDAPPPGLRW